MATLSRRPRRGSAQAWTHSPPSSRRKATPARAPSTRTAGSRSGYACNFERRATGPQRLRLPKVSSAVEVTLNGEVIGARAWEPYEFELPELRESGNRLEVAVFSAAANKYYDGTPYRQHSEPSGLLAPPVILRS